jgi:hypothetical protein
MSLYAVELPEADSRPLAKADFTMFSSVSTDTVTLDFLSAKAGYFFL